MVAWEIDHRSASFPGSFQGAAQLFIQLKKWRSRLSEDEIAEFLTKTERKESKNTQNMLLDG